MDLNQFTIVGEQQRANVMLLQNTRLIKIRWFYFSILTVVASISYFIAGHKSLAMRYLLIGLLGLGLNGLMLIANYLFKSRRLLLQILMILQVGFDLGIASLVTYQQGGLEARTSVLFTLPIVATGLIFSHLVVYLTAILSGIGYVVSIYIYSEVHNKPLDTSNAFVPLVFYPVFFVIFARLVVYLMKMNMQATKEEAYDAFLALLSHQLKHPISTANAIFDVLEHSETQTAAKQRDYVAMLKTENQNLLLLLNNLLETAAPPATVDVQDEVDLPFLLQNVAYQSAQTYYRVEDLKLNLPSMSLMVAVNSERLATAVANVINNAFRYSESGTPVSVSMQKAGNNVIVTIEDKGKGISRSARAHLSQKYSVNTTQHGGIKGLGLGLYVAKKIITAHNGSIHFISSKSGTKVIITLKRGKKT